MTDNPCPSSGQLAQWLACELPGAAGQLVAAHVNECPLCQGILDDGIRHLSGLVPPGSPGAVTGPGSATAATPAPAVPGYEILEELGRGGMGVVYKARQVGAERAVALKVLKAGVAADAGERERFRIEARAAARLQHPNVVQVYDVNEHAGLLYFSMELAEGGTLKGKLAGGHYPPREAALLAEALAWGVQHAHERGVVHRDLKPANILFTEQGDPKVADFGLAKRLDAPGPTVTGVVMGTAEYMAPEQARGQTADVDARSDVYALGAVLYELLTGRPPFLGATVLDVLRKTCEEDPVSVRRLESGVPRDLETICLKCLHKEPDKRYPTAGGLAEDLRRFRGGEPIVARPVGGLERSWRWGRRNPRLAATGAAAVAALVAAAVVSVALAVVSARSEDRQAQLLKEVSAERRRAEEQSERLNGAAQGLARVVSLVAVKDVRPDLVKKDVEINALREACAVLERLPPETPDFAVYRRLLANVSLMLGTHYRNQRRFPEAEEFLTRALKAWEEVVGNDARDHQARNELANSRYELGAVYRDTGRPAGQNDEWVKSAEVLEALANDFPDQPNYADNGGRTCYNLGVLASLEGRHDAAVGWQDRALSAFEKMPRERSLKGPTAWFVWNAHAARARSLTRLGRHDEALAHWDRALEVAPEADRGMLRLERCGTLARLGNPTAAVAQAEAAVGQEPDGEQSDELARVFAAAAAAARLAQPARDQLVEEYARRAVKLLARADAAGYYKTPQQFRELREDPLFEPLRGRPDYEEFLKTVPAP